jgi:hypothetical protein
MEYLMERAGSFEEDNIPTIGDHSPPIVNRTGQEIWDTISMRYGLIPSDLPLRCDGCDAQITHQHALCCRKGGLVI